MRGVRSGSRTTSWARSPRSIGGSAASETSARAAPPSALFLPGRSLQTEGNQGAGAGGGGGDPRVGDGHAVIR